MNHVVRLGTRGSRLARAQAEIAAGLITARHPSVSVDIVPITTTGDIVLDRPLHAIGGKGLFVREIELALLDGTIDLAVHSYKDLPVTMPLVDQSQLIIACVPEREDPSDVVIFRNAATRSISPGMRVGTSSLRRRCQVLEMCPTVQILDVRGNIDTRLRKLVDGDFDALVLATAGLKRAGLYDPSTMHAIAILPAPGQGALAIQCRKSDVATVELMSPLNHLPSQQCVEAERRVVELLDGNCQSPIAALGSIVGDTMRLQIAVGQDGGGLPVRRAEASGKICEALQTAKNVCMQLKT